jgi:hypothetical protein
MLTLAGMSDLARSKLLGQFKGFDVLPQSGSLRPEHLMPPSHDLITEFIMVGYEGDTAHAPRSWRDATGPGS